METERIECLACEETVDVEVGTWALDKGVCEPCYGRWQDGEVDL